MIHSFLLIGQSNMAGRGFLDEAIDVDTSHIKILRNGRWQRMFRPINFDREFSGVSLGESFAECYAKKYNVDVGLIPCADGGTSLAQWMKGEPLYDNAVFKTKLAMRTSNFAGILWHQGESDCREGRYSDYFDRLKIFIKTIRTDLPYVPIVLGGLGDYLKDCTLFEYLKNYTYINDALKRITNKDEQIAFVPATGLGANTDNLHFNSKALYEFGIRYFNEYEKIKKPDGLFKVEAYKEDSERTLMENL